MQGLFSFFTADYRDGIAYINDKRYSAGLFAVHLMNQYYRDDTAARVSVFRLSNWAVQEQLRDGYLKDTDYIAAGEEIRNIHKVLGRVRPFNLFDIESERKRIDELFSEENAERIRKHFRTRAAIGTKDYVINPFGDDAEKAEYDACLALIDEVKRTLVFYESIGDGMRDAFEGIRKFVLDIDSAERLDKEHLLPLAQETVGGKVNTETEYVTARHGRQVVSAKRICFADYYSFILTDFYEGLHAGHYPRRCPVCRRYFLMKSARRQVYCLGNAPKALTGGKELSCRKYAASISQKELAENDPVKAAYRRCLTYIRVNRYRGNITENFAAAAKRYARDLKEHAMNNDEYARKQYYIDLKPANFKKGVREYMEIKGISD